ARDWAVVVRRRGHRDAELLEQVRAAERDLRPVVGPGDAEAAELARVVELEALARGHGARGRAAQRMVAPSAEARRDAAQLRGVDAGRRPSLREMQVTSRDRAGLVEDHRRHVREVLE